MKNLPKLYKNENNITTNNNKKVCYLEKEQKKLVTEELNSIFNDLNKQNINNNIKVFIKTKKNSYETSIIIKTKKDIITIDDEKIPIEDIIYIKRIS